MPAPLLPRTLSLVDLRNEILYSKIACARLPHAGDQAQHFDELLEAWPAVFQKQLGCWDAITETNFVVGRVDDEIDDHIDDSLRSIATGTTRTTESTSRRARTL